TGTLDGQGVATFTASALAVGGHTVTADYSGDSTFTGSTASVTQTVNTSSASEASSVSLASSLNPSVFGQAVTFTATIGAVAPGSGTPTGTVTFSTGGTTLGTAALDGQGVATLVVSSLPAGDSDVTANYSGDMDFSGSSGDLTQTVGQADTATTLSA